MKQVETPSQIKYLICHSGFVVMENPSNDYPAAISLLYRHNPDGSVRWLWPEGCLQGDFLRFDSVKPQKTKWHAIVGKLCLALGLGSLIADGRVTLYADASTAAYILNKWHRPQ